MDLSGRWIDQVRCRTTVNEIILDMDSSVSPTHGQQEGTAYNGHFECTCYHPLFCFNQFGDLERALLREACRAETTIKKHRATLRASLKWAKQRGMLHGFPEIRMTT